MNFKATNMAIFTRSPWLQMISRRYCLFPSVLCVGSSYFPFMHITREPIAFLYLIFLIEEFSSFSFFFKQNSSSSRQYFIVVFYVNFAINAWIIFLLKKIISEYFFWDDFFYLFGTYTLNMVICLVFYHIVS